MDKANSLFCYPSTFLALGLYDPPGEKFNIREAAVNEKTILVLMHDSSFARQSNNFF